MGDQPQRCRLGADAFRRQHLTQVFVNGLRCHRAQIELQTTRQHRHGHLLRIRGGQHELQVFRRLFQRLEHGVERRVGQHVHFVDHEDLEAPLHRLVHRLFQQRLDFVHAAIGGCVKFGVVDKTPAVDFGTRLAYAARRGRDAALPVSALAIQRLGQYPRHRGLADTARSGKQVGVVQTLSQQRIGQRLYHVALTHHFSEIAGTVLAGEHEVRHARILRCRQRLPNPLQSRSTGLPAW